MCCHTSDLCIYGELVWTLWGWQLCDDETQHLTCLVFHHWWNTLMKHMTRHVWQHTSDVVFHHCLPCNWDDDNCVMMTTLWRWNTTSDVRRHHHKVYAKKFAMSKKLTATFTMWARLQQPVTRHRKTHHLVRVVIIAKFTRKFAMETHHPQNVIYTRLNE